MNHVTRSLKLSWQPVVTAYTNTWDYWLHWRVLLCAFWVAFSMVAASVLIWKYESSSIRDPKRREETNQVAVGYLYDEESWRPCLKDVHPVWLLIFRVIAFFLMLALLVINVVVDGGSIFYYYTQWTFMLVTIYFGVCNLTLRRHIKCLHFYSLPRKWLQRISHYVLDLKSKNIGEMLFLGSLLSINGCYQYLNRVGGGKGDSDELDKERHTYLAPTHEEGVGIRSTRKNSTCQEEPYIQRAGIWDYIFQIIYQICAGAVMLTDFVFWLIMVPFLTARDYKLNFIVIVMHSINVVFLIGDTAFNCLRFPWFRISYFLVWTGIYTIFQWVIHACMSIWWPYPFLDLSCPWAPVWYLLVALMHIPCYAVFCFIVKTKHVLFSRWFPESYQCSK